MNQIVEAILGCGLIHQVQFFARLEPDRLTRRNAHFGAGPGDSVQSRSSEASP